MHYLKVPGNNGGNIIKPDLIIRIEGSNNYSKVYMEGERPLVVSKVLRWFEEQLPDSMFTRVHRSHLINKNYVHQVNTQQPSELLLSNGDVISISRRKRRQLHDWKNSFINLTA